MRHDNCPNCSVLGEEPNFSILFDTGSVYQFNMFLHSWPEVFAFVGEQPFKVRPFTHGYGANIVIKADR